MPQLGEDPEWVLPFQFMNVGDSFFIPTLKPADMTYTIKSKSIRAKIRVKIFTATRNGLLGIRVWRIG